MRLTYRWLLPLLTITIASCAVVSLPANEEAVSEDIAYEDLLVHVDQYTSKAVVLGGYVSEVRNRRNLSELVLVQAPLGLGQMPQEKELSRGRLILEYDGFLDPEVYARDRMVTVGGRVIDAAQAGDSPEFFPFVRLKVLALHLWPEKQADPYWYYYDDTLYDRPFPPPGLGSSFDWWRLDHPRPAHR